MNLQPLIFCLLTPVSCILYPVSYYTIFPTHSIMQNEPNFIRFSPEKAGFTKKRTQNEPNSNPIRTQYEPNLCQNEPKTNPILSAVEWTQSVTAPNFLLKFILKNTPFLNKLLIRTCFLSIIVLIARYLD
jgi:hypothetical protein